MEKIDKPNYITSEKKSIKIKGHKNITEINSGT